MGFFGSNKKGEARIDDGKTNYNSTGVHNVNDPEEIPVVTGELVQTNDYVAHEHATGSGNDEGGMLHNLNPEVTQPMPALPTKEEKIYQLLKKTQYYMDESITLPIIGRKIGLDPIVGLIPVIGDFTTAAVSLSLVATAAPVLSKYTVMRMLINVYIDTLIGAIPFLGDIFDIGWKSNVRNVKIYEDFMIDSKKRSDTDKKFIWTVVIAFILICIFTTIAFVLIVILIILWLLGFFK